MLVVISNPMAIANEASIINALFDEGLEILHVRKPGVAIDEMSALIEQIKPQYLHQVALHQHLEIAGDLGIHRLHFTEVKRKKVSEEKLMQLKRENNMLSTSIHQTEEYQNLSPYFDYSFYGPVFDSISKQGYTSTNPDDFIFPVQLNRPRVIAIGGIDSTNIQKAVNMQFYGVAVLGTIWQKPGESIQQFKALQKAWKQTGR
ncbi:MAG TPA: thiamine phosphate synthase [Prolixibacteraceae bacterium]|nr:thiamine phosphate synthase [Prolixibacteraceae bacterium]